MPLYEYKCKGCKYEFEAFTTIEDRHTQLCPQCAHAAEMVLKGGNFSIPGTDPHFPTSADKWAKRHRRANRKGLQDLGIPVD